MRTFHKHLEEMYQKPVHGRGTLQQADLTKISLGNEYDVQHMSVIMAKMKTKTESLEDGFTLSSR